MIPDTGILCRRYIADRPTSNSMRTSDYLFYVTEWEWRQSVNI